MVAEMMLGYDAAAAEVREGERQVSGAHRFIGCGSIIILLVLAFLTSLAMRGCTATPVAASDVIQTPAPAEAHEQLAPTADFVRRPWGLLSFNGQSKTFRWTLELLTERSLAVNVTRRDRGFHSDLDIPKPLRVSPFQYEHSDQVLACGANAANHRSSDAEYESTFAMSNTVPMYKAAAECLRRLEDSIRTAAGETVNAWVLTAPAYLPGPSGRIVIRTIGTMQIWQPTHLVKAILIEPARGPRECLAWIVPNVPEPNESFDAYRASTLEAIEALGIRLWPNVSDEELKRIGGQR